MDRGLNMLISCPNVEDYGQINTARCLTLTGVAVFWSLAGKAEDNVFSEGRTFISGINFS